MMLRKSPRIATLMAALLIPSVMPATAQANEIELPTIGTAAASTLSIGKEIELGDLYLRQLRQQAPISNDPLINSYINKLGGKLVAKADSVQTPFNFFVMNSNVINAFAFFGGNVVIHSKLILATDNESELASVMAHEISHVTQRHLARRIESQNSSNPYVWGSALGGLLLALANPQAGMAVFTSSIAGFEQGKISFTQGHEQEADRVGLRTLSRAGFDPQGSPDFLNKLADKARFSSSLPEMLFTHPLPTSRLADIRSRAAQLPSKTVASSLDYYLAKARLAVFSREKIDAQLLMQAYQTANSQNATIALGYAKALSAYESNNYSQARSTLEPLLSANPRNSWFIDLMTDIDLAQNRAPAAIARLQSALKSDATNQVLQINLANAYIKARDWPHATNLLHRFTHSHPTSLIGWDMLAQVYSQQQLRGEEMSARAEMSALQGKFDEAIRLLNNAQSYIRNNASKQARLTARVEQIKQLQQRYARYQR